MYIQKLKRIYRISELSKVAGYRDSILKTFAFPIISGKKDLVDEHSKKKKQVQKP